MLNKVCLNWLFHKVLTNLPSMSAFRLTGARTSVLWAGTECAVQRPASVSTGGNATTWAAPASVKRAFLVNTVRRACVLMGSTASDVTSAAPATWTTLTGEGPLPLEGEIGREIPTPRPFLPLSCPGQEPLSEWKTFVLGGRWSKSEVLTLSDGCGWIANPILY